MSDDANLTAGLPLAILLAVLGVALLAVTGRRRPTLQLEIRLFLVALGIRVLFAIGIYAFGGVDIIKDEDANGVWMGSLSAYTDWMRSGYGVLDLPRMLSTAYESTRHGGFIYLMGAWFVITGSPGRVSGAVLNCFFGALTVALAYRTALLVFSRWVAERVGWWTCLFPSMIIWSALTIKEPLVILLETIALYACVQLNLKGFSVKHMAFCVVTIFLLVPLRFYAVYVIGFVAVASLALPSLIQPGRALRGSLVAACLLPALLLSASIARRDQSSEFVQLQQFQEFRKSVASGGAEQGAGSGVATDDITKPTGFVKGLTVGVAHLLLAPFPWQINPGSPRQMLTIPEIVYWWWLVFVGLIPGLRYAIKHHFRESLALLLFVAAFGLLYSLTFGNVGLIFRQRGQLLPWLFIFVAVGMEQRGLAQLRRHQAEMAIQAGPRHGRRPDPGGGIRPE